VSTGKRQQGVCGANSHPLSQLKAQKMQMPIVAVNINGCFRRALVDTGCTTTIVHSTVVAER